MSNHYLDTSGLVKHYHPEIGTPKVDRLWADPGTELLISRLSVVEAVSVLAKKVRSGTISAADLAFFGGGSSQTFGDGGPRSCGCL
jgi:hypothetical protein